MLIKQAEDTSEFWRETEMLSLVRNNEMDIDYEKCEQSSPEKSIVHFPSRRLVRPICRSIYGMSNDNIDLFLTMFKQRLLRFRDLQENISFYKVVTHLRPNWRYGYPWAAAH